MEIVGQLISSKKGKLYFKLIVVVAVFAALVSAIFTLADSPSAVPRVFSTANASTVNVTSAFIADHLIGYSNFTNQNGSQEENSMSEIRDFRASSEAKASETFKWYKRTLYQPQSFGKLSFDVRFTL